MEYTLENTSWQKIQWYGQRLLIDEYGDLLAVIRVTKPKEVNAVKVFVVATSRDITPHQAFLLMRDYHKSKSPNRIVIKG